LGSGCKMTGPRRTYSHGLILAPLTQSVIRYDTVPYCIRSRPNRALHDCISAAESKTTISKRYGHTVQAVARRRACRLGEGLRLKAVAQPPVTLAALTLPHVRGTTTVVLCIQFGDPIARPQLPLKSTVYSPTNLTQAADQQAHPHACSAQPTTASHDR
jgi:hypothetical protein